MRVLSFSNVLNDLDALERRLLEPRVDFWISQQDEEKREKFSECQSDLSNRIGELRNKRLEKILAQLTSNEDALKKGIDKLRREIAELDKIAETIQAISDIIGTLSSILKPLIPSP